MNKLISKAAILTLGLALAAGVGVAVGSKKASAVRADDIVINYSDIEGLTSTAGDQTGSYDNFQFDFNGLCDGHVRVYADKTLTITSLSGSDMTSIVLTCTVEGSTKGGPGCLSKTEGEYVVSGNTGTWTGSSDVVTFNAVKQCRITSFAITYEGGGVVTKYVVTYDPNGGTVSPTAENKAENSHPSFPTPTKVGYDFVGWRIGTSTGEFADESYLVTGPVTFVADWLEHSTGEGVTIDLTAQGFTNAQEVTSVTSGSFTLSFNKGSGSNPPKYYTSGSSVRTYASNTLTISTSGSENIVAIEFVLGSDKTAEPSVDVGAYDKSKYIWSGSAKSITFTNKSSGQYHYKEVTITVEASPIPGYTAAEFAQQLLDATGAVCTGYDGHTNNKPYLMPIWAELAGSTRYAGLPTDQKTILIETEGDESSENVVERAMARYDYLVAKYGLTNFISGHVVKASFYFEDNALSIGNSNVLIIVISIASASVLAFSALMLLKKKKQK